MTKAEDIRSREVSRTLKKLRALSDEEQYSLDAMTRSIVSKILKEPIHYLKATAGHDGDYSRMVDKLFGLSEGKQV